MEYSTTFNLQTRGRCGQNSPIKPHPLEIVATNASISYNGKKGRGSEVKLEGVVKLNLRFPSLLYLSPSEIYVAGVLLLRYLLEISGRYIDSEKSLKWTVS
ncbi:hypothetical protein CEXT_710241 [Caerostris extrusa]|uniref:Uncharacterized protein n=1 Tax=Caerostris extrusa TaxID=172846 RepID=A0AAV4NXV6_CAEEX|nr:hypothetical protein CEXT_710241 [Caerostris extrusa]